MILKLNIYNKKNITKTYTAESYDIMFGTVEDLLNLIDLEKFNNSKNDMEFIKVVTEAVVKGFDIIKPLLKDIFEGLTDDELRNTKISEIVNILVSIIKITMTQITSGTKTKN